MPCNSSDGMGDAYREDPQARRQIQAMKQELDDVIRMLYSLVRAMDGSQVPPDVAEWFIKHSAWDKSQGRP